MRERAHAGDPARHVAIIMDGNGRWATARNKRRYYGHQQGVKTVRRTVEHANATGIKALTLYAFSSENWKRPQSEIKLLFELLSLSISEQLADLHQNNIQLNVLGDQSALPIRLNRKISDAVAVTRNNSGMKLNIALNYGARWELVQAAQALARVCVQGDLTPDQLDEQRLAAELTTAGQPDLDLLIRTGGERRLSNFLLWQAAYAELYFTDTYWPDFDAQAFDQALDWFATRKRRFGQTDEQIGVKNG